MFKKITMTCLGILFLSTVISGCMSYSERFLGKSIQPVAELEEGGPHQGSWENFDIKIQYSYVQDDDKLTISGQSELGQHYQMNYEEVRYLYGYLFFLNGEARILGTDSLFFVVGTTEDITRFNKTINIPFGTTGLAFGYDGKAGGYENQSYFHYLPWR